jgi:hypothetical protein
MIHLVLFFMLIIASVFAAVPEPKQPVGFGRPFISGGKKWSSTGMGGLDHHYPEVPLEEVEFASKKSKRKPEDPIVHPEGECSDSNQPELDTLLSLTFFAPSSLSTGLHAFKKYPYASGTFSFDH